MKPGPHKYLKGEQMQAIFNIIVILSIKTWSGLQKSPEFVSWIQQIGEPGVNCCSGTGKTDKTKAFVGFFHLKWNPVSKEVFKMTAWAACVALMNKRFFKLQEF